MGVISWRKSISKGAIESLQGDWLTLAHCIVSEVMRCLWSISDLFRMPRRKISLAELCQVVVELLRFVRERARNRRTFPLVTHTRYIPTAATTNSSALLSLSSLLRVVQSMKFVTDFMYLNVLVWKLYTWYFRHQKLVANAAYKFFTCFSVSF